MSFTAEVKDELSRSEPACPLCNRAMLSAIVHIEGTLNISGSGRYRLEIATETPAVARTVVRLLYPPERAAKDERHARAERRRKYDARKRASAEDGGYPFHRNLTARRS